MWPSKGFQYKNWLQTDILLWVSFAFIHVSPAIASMGLIAFVFQLLVWGVRVEMNLSEKRAWLAFLLLLTWNVLSIFDSAVLGLITHSGGYSEVFMQGAVAKILLKLPLLMLALLFWRGRRLQSVFADFWYLAVVPMLWVSVSSVIYYFQHRAFYDQMVLESKPIPLYSKVYHIEFAVMLGVVVLMLLRELLKKKSIESVHWKQNEIKLQWASVIVLVVCMHVLGARTGLVLLYTGGLMLLIKHFGGSFASLKKLVLFGLLGLGLMMALPSTRNRIVNTLIDLKITANGGDVTHQSFGQRWIAWKTTTQLLKKDPMSAFMGVGMGVDEKLRTGYEDLDVPLAERHRIGVHNQWLETSLQSGWISAIGLMVLGFLVFTRSKNSSSNSGWVLWLALIVAMMFESLLERQAGVLVVIIAFQVMNGEKIWQNSEIKSEDTLIN